MVWGVGEKEECCGRNARLLVNASDVMSFLDDFNCQRKMSGRSQGGEDTQDAVSCGLFFSKEPLILGLFCGNHL